MLHPLFHSLKAHKSRGAAGQSQESRTCPMPWAAACGRGGSVFSMKCRHFTHCAQLVPPKSFLVRQRANVFLLCYNIYCTVMSWWFSHLFTVLYDCHCCQSCVFLELISWVAQLVGRQVKILPAHNRKGCAVFLGDGSSSYISATHVGDAKGFPYSWLQLGSDLAEAKVRLSEETQKMEVLPFFSLSSPFSIIPHYK